MSSHEFDVDEAPWTKARADRFARPLGAGKRFEGVDPANGRAGQRPTCGHDRLMDDPVIDVQIAAVMGEDRRGFHSGDRLFDVADDVEQRERGRSGYRGSRRNGADARPGFLRRPGPRAADRQPRVGPWRRAPSRTAKSRRRPGTGCSPRRPPRPGAPSCRRIRALRRRDGRRLPGRALPSCERALQRSAGKISLHQDVEAALAAIEQKIDDRELRFEVSVLLGI